MKTVGVVGLGLIGGSFVKAYRESDEWKVFGFDINDKVNQFAELIGDIDDTLCDENIGECDLILLTAYPEACLEWLNANAAKISESTVVIDCCGVKRGIVDEGFRIANENGFTFVGGHPMAGRHFSGYKYAKEDLYKDQPMVIVPEKYDDIEFFERVEDLLKPARFGRFTVTNADEHDEMIAFTSQLAHVVSNAYIKSPRAGAHDGLSAGSYKDLTRVAWLNEDMWTELFMDNRDNLINELDCIIGNLEEYRDALEREDSETLKRLLKEGSDKKEAVDGVK